MWTFVSQLFSFTYGMIYRFSYRVLYVLSRLRLVRPLPPWSSTSTTADNTVIIDSNENLIPSEVGHTAANNQTLSPHETETPDIANTVVAITISETQCSSGKMSDSPNKKIKLEDTVQSSQIPTCSSQKDSIQIENESSKKSKINVRKQKEDKKSSGLKPRPNHFVAIQVSNPEIILKVNDLQQKILSSDITSKVINKYATNGQIFKDTLVKKEKLHFTLHVFHLKDEDDKKRASAALENCYLKCKSEFESEPMRLNIEGLGHFRHGVIFAKIKGEDHISRLEALSEDIRQEFQQMNISGDPKPFRPHMTIAKLSKSKTLAKKKIRSYPPEIWSDYQAEHLGYQKVESVQLLSMMDTDSRTGYYGSIAQFYFHPTTTVPDLHSHSQNCDVAVLPISTTTTITTLPSHSTTTDSDANISVSSPVVYEQQQQQHGESFENSNGNDPIEKPSEDSTKQLPLQMEKH